MQATRRESVRHLSCGSRKARLAAGFPGGRVWWNQQREPRSAVCFRPAEDET